MSKWEAGGFHTRPTQGSDRSIFNSDTIPSARELDHTTLLAPFGREKVSFDAELYPESLVGLLVCWLAQYWSVIVVADLDHNSSL